MRGGNRVASTDPFPEDREPYRPKSLDSDENKYWTLLIEQIPPRMLRSVDAHQLQSLVALLSMRDRLQSLVRADPADLKSGRLFLQVVQSIGKLSVAFGLAPIDRQRLRIAFEVEEDDDPIPELMAKLGAKGYGSRGT